ncbi:MAG: hypothetical protein ACYTFG_03020 [Planctomycetota bacterium]|jgi:hypothetical protein
MPSAKELVQREIRAFREKYQYWTKVNMVLCGVCLLSPLLISHVFNKINALSLIFAYFSAAAALGLAIGIPGARAAGYVVGMQRLKNALEGFKAGKVTEEGLERAVKYEAAQLTAVSAGGAADVEEEESTKSGAEDR